MTRRLYYEDGYRTEFEAELRESLYLPDGRFALFLDATYFYPTSGGQPHDLGRLAGLELLEVLEHERGIAHVVATRPDAPPGTLVSGRIDAERRRAHREQHTGQHILSRAIEELLDRPTDSARLGETHNTIDLRCDTIDGADLERVFARANEIVREARPVRVQMVDVAESDSQALRKKSERSGIVRIIEVEGFDRCPCGGTHVRNTGEIGLIVPLRTEGITGGVRVHFLCGQRALVQLRRRDRILTELSQRFTSGAEELAARFEKLAEENKSLQRQIGELAASAMREQATQWLSEAQSTLFRGRRLRYLVRELDAGLAERIHAAQPVLLAQPDLLSILVLRGAERIQIAVCAGGDCGIDCAAVLREWLGSLGKGGGRADQARGSLAIGDLPELKARIERDLGAPA